MVGLESAQRFLEHPQRQVFPASVGADLCHQEDFLALAAEGRAHPVLGFAPMILPAVIEERDTAVDGGVRDPRSCLEVLKIAQVMAAQSERRNFYACVTERPERNTVRPCRLTHNPP